MNRTVAATETLPTPSFDELQEKLVSLWHSIERLNESEQTIVVVCSLTLDEPNMPASVLQAYEERFLFLLFLLRQPRARLVYVTSQEINPTIVDYYLGLLPGVIASHARRRLHLLSPLDGSSKPLSQKLLARPRLLRRIRDFIPDPDRAHLIPFNTTELERDLAIALGIPMYGADPKFFPLGTKTGCRRLFTEEGVKHPLGREDISSVAEAVEAIESMRAEQTGIEQGIVGDDFRSPSVQLRVTPLGKLEVLSTHDQLLGGPSGQSYLGCRFPGDEDYAAAITREAVKVGERLAREGVLGRFAIDFVAVKRNGAWDPYAIELNLRKGGTTHPFLTLQFLTDGTYDPETAVFTAPSGRPKCFVASDHVENPAYRTLTHDDLFDIAVRHGLHFDHARQTGVVYHMMSALGEHGRTGLTAVGEAHEEAGDLYERAVAALDEESQAALAAR